MGPGNEARGAPGNVATSSSLLHDPESLDLSPEVLQLLLLSLCLGLEEHDVVDCCKGGDEVLHQQLGTSDIRVHHYRQHHFGNTQCSLQRGVSSCFILRISGCLSQIHSRNRRTRISTAMEMAFILEA